MSAHTCTCCGAELRPRRPQWWNQDTGMGICDPCAAGILHLPGHRPIGGRPEPIDAFEQCYGRDGTHFELPDYRFGPLAEEAAASFDGITEQCICMLVDGAMRAAKLRERALLWVKSAPDPAFWIGAVARDEACIIEAADAIIRLRAKNGEAAP